MSRFLPQYRITRHLKGCKDVRIVGDTPTILLARALRNYPPVTEDQNAHVSYILSERNGETWWGNRKTVKWKQLKVMTYEEAKNIVGEGKGLGI